MTETYLSLLSNSYLRAVLDSEFKLFSESETEKKLISRLEKWSKKKFQKETAAESAFINIFFNEIWGYSLSGKGDHEEGFTCYPQFPVSGAGAGGGVGAADAALGFFDNGDALATPQVLCEFKDVRSNLDGPQKRKGNNRSPVKQCADYLREAMKPLYGNEAIQPTWGIVTDMNEFRLYWRNTMPSQFQRFIIKKATTDDGISLISAGETASFQRFLFTKIFHANTLLTKGGQSELLKLVNQQGRRQKEIERSFYLEYKAYRECLVDLVIKHNPKFKGTKGRLVRLTQKLIDRCIFVMFCEDMGEQLAFPPNALRDYLSELSRNATFEPDEQDAWNKLKELFQAMNLGKKFRSRPINRFNGGLFAVDAQLDGLSIPNEAFCVKLQGDAPSSNKQALLYFAASYNFGASEREGHAITLYTLGRIFEQSITELEALEAEKDERESLTIISKRKRDGVYYTPEWVVEKVVAETLSPRLDEIRTEVGWSLDLEGDEAAIAKQMAKSPSDRSAAFNRHAQGVRAFRDRLDVFTVLDPACGSGAFLIHTLEFLLRERRRVQRELALVTAGKGEELFEFKPDDEIRSILSRNIFGVDINPASVEIARLALWLHTAKSNQPLSNLDPNIVEGNSLVGKEMYTFKKDLLSAPASKQELINVFDYEDQFEEIFNKGRPDGSGFDCVVGNPPYVKIQNFKKVYPETADFLRNATGKGGAPRYASCQTGSFDLYLPFIERGLELLNDKGRLGYIAPSLWRYSDYGKGLKSLLHSGGHLDRWIDFGSFQVFDEATIYTALQFYTRHRNDRVRFALAPTGDITQIHDWDDADWFISYNELPKDSTWIFVSRPEREVIARLNKACKKLGDPSISRQIFQGLITSLDHVYHLDRVGKNRYLHHPPKEKDSDKKPYPVEIEVEDDIMHPLVSGQETGRYTRPKTKTYILFPYDASGDEILLFTKEKLAKQFPKAWKHLKGFEAKLRARQDSKFDDDTWWRFGRHQSLDKQEFCKLIVPSTVRRLSVCADFKGEFYLNNVRVNGILPKNKKEFWYILGILNSDVANWVFQRSAKPKDNQYFEANKQFIFPIPIPKADAADAEKIATLALKLSDLHSERRDTLEELERRYEACQYEEKPPEWLWPAKVRSLEKWKTKAPVGLGLRDKAAWARGEQEKEVALAIDELNDRLRPAASLKAKLVKGELQIIDDETIVLDGVFADAQEARQILSEWQFILRSNTPSETFNGEELAARLRWVRLTENAAVAKQIQECDEEITRLDRDILLAEGKLNKTADKSYRLSSIEHGIIYGSLPS